MIPRRAGLSLTEMVLAAMIIGVSALPVLELLRSTTAHLEVTEIEAAARALAGDVVERLSGSTADGEPPLGERNAQQYAVPQAWQLLFQNDRSLGFRFPGGDLARLLDTYDVRVRIVPQFGVTHPTRGKVDDLVSYEVHVQWNEKNGETKEVVHVCLVEV